MIRTFEVRLNAAHPELPLMEATAIVGSPSSATIHGVPATIGAWTVTRVYVRVSYPDGSTVTAEAARTAQGLWTATVPQCATSGRVRGGFEVLADGIDENNQAVTGYTLGIGDFAVYTKGLIVRDGEKYYALRLFDAVPETPAEGDVAHIDGVLMLYNGAAWEAFGSGGAGGVTEEEAKEIARLEAPYAIVPNNPAGEDADRNMPTLTLAPRRVNLTVATQSSIALEFGTLPQREEDGVMRPLARDMIWRLDCTDMPDAPALQWPEGCRGANDDDDLAPEAGKVNVFFITEVAPDEFLVSRKAYGSGGGSGSSSSSSSSSSN